MSDSIHGLKNKIQKLELQNEVLKRKLEDAVEIIKKTLSPESFQEHIDGHDLKVKFLKSVELNQDSKTEQ